MDPKSVFVFTLLVCVSSAVVVEKFASPTIGYGWREAGRADSSRLLELTFAVKQTNLASLESTLLRVSDPDHADFGKHMSREEVDALVAPSPISVATVLTFLESHGVKSSAVKTTANADFITAVVPVELAERMLDTKYFNFRHDSSSVELLRVKTGYSLPDEVAACVDFVSPTVRFPMVHQHRLRFKNSTARKLLGLFGSVTPATLRTLYGTTGVTAAENTGNVQAVASFLGQFYSPSDLQKFFSSYDTEAEGRTPTLLGPNTPSKPGTEASLDIQYVMALGNGVDTQFWSTAGEQPHNPQNEPFLTWLLNVANTSDASMPRTISVSYGDNEGGVNFDYATRVNTEFQKAGVRGISIMFSSGDGGVAGGQSTSCTTFIPTFPAGSPWVTAVGGTTGSSPETAASFSSGGFSNYWLRPAYQAAAVNTYMSVAGSKLPSPSRYNHTGAGIPDVSAQSEGFTVVVRGSPVLFGVDGTSCASPTFTGVMSLVNDARLAAGKGPLGYLNLLFYKHPEVFTDITEGNNPGCGTNGFYAAKGWDPVTGLGTPVFSKLKQLALSLP